MAEVRPTRNGGEVLHPAVHESGAPLAHFTIPFHDRNTYGIHTAHTSTDRHHPIHCIPAEVNEILKVEALAPSHLVTILNGDPYGLTA